MTQPLNSPKEVLPLLFDLLYQYWKAECTDAEIIASVKRIDPDFFTGEFGRAWDDLVVARAVAAGEVSDQPSVPSDEVLEGWTAIRPATEADCYKLDLAADRFCREWGLEVDRDGTAEGAIYLWAHTMKNDPEHLSYNPERGVHMLNLWEFTVQEVLRHHKAQGIVGMTVGYGDMFKILELGPSDEE